ncbi:MAG: BCCT family transporter [Archaeoglobaceae archaeon]
MYFRRLYRHLRNSVSTISRYLYRHIYRYLNRHLFHLLGKDTVFRISLVIVLSFVLIGVYSPQLLSGMSSLLHQTIINLFGWFYLLAGLIFLIFCLALAFSRYGDIKLGKDYERPQYTYFGWFSMLFAAGMGIGLVFWGVAEPVSHYINPPSQITPTSGESASFAMRYSFFHWGLHPWAIYIIMSLSIAYFSFRRGMSPLISSCFYPILGEKIYRAPGHLIDILAVFATIFGVVTSLGLGALQINSGLAHVYGLPSTTNTTLIIIAVVTAMYMYSSIQGLDKGIQVLSKSNMFLAGALLIFLFVIGPTPFILNVFTSTLGEYANQIVEMSLQTNPFQGYDWIQTWTLFYWAWWISWSPFVGLFVARISRGRTIREFILGALFVPAIITFFWFSVFGGAALYLEQFGGGEIGQAVSTDVSTALFVVFDNFPLAPVLSTLAVISLVVFFVTSADSATYVLGMMTSKGVFTPPIYKKIIWGLTQSTVAAILLVAGGLETLQQMAITAALPFTLVMLLMCYTLLYGLRQEK